MENKTEVLKGVKLYYPEARDWMWDYCVYLGPYTSPSGEHLDLGVYLSDFTLDHSVSLAAVYGNNDGDYISGMINSTIETPMYVEALKRAYALGLVNKDGSRKEY